MRLRVLLAVAVAALLVLLLAVPALAANGEGLSGETNDQAVTAWGLGLVLAFPLVALLANAIQSALERRKERRKAAALRQRAGW